MCELSVDTGGAETRKRLQREDTTLEWDLGSFFFFAKKKKEKKRKRR
jgi:hypothetical protein